jgi:hypothetical protein
MKKLLPTLVVLAALLLGTERPSAADDKLFKDPNPDVRLKAALAQAKANNPAAVPVLIDLLAVLPVNKRGPVEEYLRELAGDWAPTGGPTVEDEIARKIYRDSWAAWWSNTDGPALLAMLKKRTLSQDDTEKVKDAIRRLGDKSFAARGKAVVELVAVAGRCCPSCARPSKIAIWRFPAERSGAFSGSRTSRPIACRAPLFAFWPCANRIVPSKPCWPICPLPKRIRFPTCKRLWRRWRFGMGNPIRP